MKTIRNLVPVLALLAVLIGLALGIGFLNRGGTGQQDTELVDNGPNAGLSNGELVSVAITNMKALDSYRFEFKGGMPSMGTRMSSNLSITGDVQLHGKGARWSVRDEGGGVFGGNGMNFDVGAGIDGVRGTGGGWWESYDGGKTWVDPEAGDTQLSFLLLWLDCRWGNLFTDEEQTGDPHICEALASQLDYKDGTPRLERIDGTVTRHMVGTYGDQEAQASGQALTVDLWVSTDITPTLRRLHVEGTNKLYENIVEGVNEVAFSPDGSTLAAAHGRSLDSTIRLYDVGSPGPPQRKLTHGTGPFYSVDISPDGRLMAATSYVPAGSGSMSEGGYGVYIWDLISPDSEPVSRTLPADVWYVRFQPNGELLAAGAHEGIYLFDPRDAEAAPTVLPIREGLNLRGFAFSRDGQTLAAETFVWDDATGEVLIYDVRYPEKAPVRIAHEDSSDDVALSPDGRFLASAVMGIGSDTGGYTSVWDLSRPQAPPITLPSKSGDDPAVTFSPDGKFLVTLSNDNQIEFWDTSLFEHPVATHSPAMALAYGEERANDVAFSLNGRKMAVAMGGGEVLVWEMDEVTGKQGPGGAKPRVYLEEQVLIDKPFTLTWTWSRFNEDFGRVERPPAESIK